MDSRREAKIAGLTLAAIYVICLMCTAYGMNGQDRGTRDEFLKS